jgi:hypothetical protein
MLHAYVERFDVMDGRGNILGWDGEVNKARYSLRPKKRVILASKKSTTFNFDQIYLTKY